VIDKSTASFVQSLCMGRVLEEMLIPFPTMKEAEQETLEQVLQSVNQLLGPREKDFRRHGLRVGGLLPHPPGDRHA
jgi:hypothetical protein